MLIVICHERRLEVDRYEEEGYSPHNYGTPGFWNKAIFWQTVLNTDQDSGGPWRRTSPPNHLKAQKGPSRCLPWAAIAAVGALGGLPRLKWEWKWERAVKWTQASGHQNFQLSENSSLLLRLNKFNLSWQLLATCLVTWPFENLEGLVTWSSLLQWPGGSGGSLTPSCLFIRIDNISFCSLFLLQCLACQSSSIMRIFSVSASIKACYNDNNSQVF